MRSCQMKDSDNLALHLQIRTMQYQEPIKLKYLCKNPHCRISEGAVQRVCLCLEEDFDNENK